VLHPRRSWKSSGRDLQTVLARPDVTQKFQDLGTSIRHMSAHELSDFIRSEQDLWRPVIPTAER
jgi:tripartite-type tricarboxylate transporter receptor subunit TctC